VPGKLPVPARLAKAPVEEMATVAAQASRQAREPAVEVELQWLRQAVEVAPFPLEEVIHRSGPVPIRRLSRPPEPL
jgi:hypothetical protein